MSGFSHGNTGICYALYRLSCIDENASFSEYARRGWAFEDLHRCDDGINWRDLRPHVNANARSWCYGAPGIVLGRLPASLLSSEQLELFARYLEDGVNEQLGFASGLLSGKRHATLWSDGALIPLRLSDLNLCCGCAGVLDVLLVIAEALSCESLRSRVTVLAKRMLMRVSRSELLYNQSTDVGLFSGLAGIGYLCLRIRVPTLPCILAFAV